MSTHKGPIRALICDDDPISLLIMESLVDSAGLEVITTPDVATTKKLLPKVIPHLAILDIMLPDGDGVDILLEMKRLKLPTAVALITATLSEFPYHKCGANLPDMIFAKPFDPAALSAWIESQKPFIIERMTAYEKAAESAA